jgi:hypothetical protein
MESNQLLDTELLFSGESHNGVIGSELLYDHVHLTPLGGYADNIKFEYHDKEVQKDWDHSGA